MKRPMCVAVYVCVVQCSDTASVCVCVCACVVQCDDEASSQNAERTKEREQSLGLAVAVPFGLLGP